MRWFAGAGGGAAISGWDDDDMRSERGAAVKPFLPLAVAAPSAHAGTGGSATAPP
eukprot:COSAG01_NODE_382_length_17840_cov_68.658663_11_plen_55_part_00